jgi:hypothetical protein
MSWKLIFALSLFGLAMAFATVFVVPTHIEPWIWLGIFVVCAVVIAKRAPGKYFFHGLSVSLLNSVYITAVHVALFDKYVASHAREAAMTAQMGHLGSPQVVMAITGPVIGLASGIVLGLFSWIASKFLMPSHGDYAGW